jgi:hypothetical protein
VGTVPVVINNQDASLFFDRQARHSKSFERQRLRGGIPTYFRE